MSTTGHHWWEAERRRTTAVQQGLNAVSWVFLLMGVMGFIPALTPGFDGIRFAGPGDDAELFGVFAVSILTNLIHLVYGVFGLIMSWMAKFARRTLIGGGVFFTVLGLYGLIVDLVNAGDFLPSTWATGLLHLGLGVLMIVLGFVLHTRLPKESEARGEGDFGETNRGAAR
jgi:4-amino-4-deoxy-L-arabinose transferase-like glycosyltransferase